MIPTTPAYLQRGEALVVAGAPQHDFTDPALNAKLQLAGWTRQRVRARDC
jgi:hypothetical protein